MPGGGSVIIGTRWLTDSVGWQANWLPLILGLDAATEVIAAFLSLHRTKVNHPELAHVHAHHSICVTWLGPCNTSMLPGNTCAIHYAVQSYRMVVSQCYHWL